MANRFAYEPLHAHAREVYLSALAELGTKARAAIAAKVSLHQIETELVNNVEFARAHDYALTQYIARLEEIARDRAINGVPRVVVRKGVIIGTELVPDNKLLLELLKAEFPGKYAPKQQDDARDGTVIQVIQYSDGKPVTIDVNGNETPEQSLEQSSDYAVTTFGES